MKEFQFRKQLLISPWIEGEDLILYGIRKIRENFKTITIKETFSPEGGEWTFIYNEILNRLFIEKEGINLVFSGDINPEILEELKKFIKEKDN